MAISAKQKCRHDRKFAFIETGDWVTTHYVSGNEIWHNNNPGLYRNAIQFTCDVCGFSKSYSRFTLPKWLKPLYDNVFNADPDNPIYREV